jgi:hypothetical protein
MFEDSENDDMYVINILFDNGLIPNDNGLIPNDNGLNKKLNNTINEIPLKGILKKSIDNLEQEELISEKFIKIIYTIFIIIFCCPITICDLYYGYTDKSCINIYQKNINMGMYLVISGYSELWVTMFYILNIYCISNNNKYINSNYLLTTRWVIIVVNLFLISFSIIGAILFENLFSSGICNVNISTYIFVSLIIKLFGNLLSITQISKKI